MRHSTVFAIIAMLLGFAVAATSGGDALAKKKKKKKKGSKTAEIKEPPFSNAIDEQLGELRWGMSPDQVLAIVKEEVREEFKQKAAEVNDIIKEDKLFNEMEKEIADIEDSYYEFEGNPKWDSSVVQDEYTHKNGESMLVVRRDKWTNYYFFITSPDYDPSASSKDPLWEQNKVVLWKLYRAFDADMFPGLDWNSVREILAKQFGENPFPVKKFDPDTKFVNVVEVRWQNKRTLLSLVNQFTFFGIFCLRFEAKHIANQLDELRVNKPADDDKKHGIIDGLAEGTGKDDEANIVDILTGKSHGAENSPMK